MLFSPFQRQPNLLYFSPSFFGVFFVGKNLQKHHFRVDFSRSVGPWLVTLWSLVVSYLEVMEVTVRWWKKIKVSNLKSASQIGNILDCDSVIQWCAMRWLSKHRKIGGWGFRQLVLSLIKALENNGKYTTTYFWNMLFWVVIKWWLQVLLVLQHPCFKDLVIHQDFMEVHVASCHCWNWGGTQITQVVVNHTGGRWSQLMGIKEVWKFASSAIWMFTCEQTWPDVSLVGSSLCWSQKKALIFHTTVLIIFWIIGLPTSPALSLPRCVTTPLWVLPPCSSGATSSA